MPDRLYPLGDKPSAWHRFLANPLATAAGIAWFYLGGIAIFEGWCEGASTSSSIGQFPQLATLLIGVLFVFAGSILLWSIYTQHSRVDVVWQWRKCAYTFALIAGGAYSYFVSANVPLEAVAFSFGIFHLLLGLFGLISVVTLETLTRRVMREQGYDA